MIIRGGGQMLFWTRWQAKSKDTSTRRRAAGRLGGRGRGADASGPLPSHVALLLTLAADPDAEVRAAAFDSLGRVGDARAADGMVALLEDRDTLAEPSAGAVRDAAVRAFQGIGAGAVPALLALLKEKHPKLRETAVAALGGIGGADAERALVAMLQDGRSSVRQGAVHALARCAAAGSVGALSAALDHKDPATRKSALEEVAVLKGVAAVTALERLTRDADRGVREMAVRGLARQNSPEAVDALLRVFEGQDRDLRRTAAAELKPLQWQPAGPAQRALHAILRGEYRAAAAEGEAAIEPLAALLAEKVAEVRRAGAEALGAAGHPNAVAPLLVALQDQDQGVRQAAGDALVRIGAAAVEPLACAVHDVVRAAAPDIVLRVGAPAALPLVARLEQGDPYTHDGSEAIQLDGDQEAECAGRAAHLLARLLGQSAHAVDAGCLRRITHLRNLVRVREIAPVNRREMPTVVVETVVDCTELCQRAAAELERRK